MRVFSNIKKPKRDQENLQIILLKDHVSYLKWLPVKTLPVISRLQMIVGSPHASKVCQYCGLMLWRGLESTEQSLADY